MTIRHLIPFVAAMFIPSGVYGQTVVIDANGNETVPPPTELQRPLPRTSERPTATLPSAAVTVHTGKGQLPLADQNTGVGEPLSQNEINQRRQVQRQGNQTAVGDFPIIGAKDLLKSLEELDKPLSPEEITAYGAAIQSQFPMSPEMIRDFRRRLDENQKAAATPPSGQLPNAINDAKRISLASAQDPEILLTGPDTVSVIAFFDKTGAAWPIASYVIGKPRSFQVYALQEGSNKLAVTPLVAHGFSNIVVSLVGEDRPLVIDVRTNSLNTHYRRDFIVEGFGPNAKRDPVSNASASTTRASDSVMMAFGTATDIPGDAVRLKTDNSAVKAWRYGGAIYLRSEHTIISPPALLVLTGAGQVKAYRIRPTPVVLISVNGQVSKVRIEQ